MRRDSGYQRNYQEARPIIWEPARFAPRQPLSVRLHEAVKFVVAVLAWLRDNEDRPTILLADTLSLRRLTL
jgi:hypothetical protein